MIQMVQNGYRGEGSGASPTSNENTHDCIGAFCNVHGAQLEIGSFPLDVIAWDGAGDLQNVRCPDQRSILLGVNGDSRC